jgi:di/tricarboxylate transporter
MNEEVLASARATNFRNRGLAWFLQSMGAIAYMLLARGLLRGTPASETASETAVRRASLAGWIALYDLPDREHRLRVSELSPLAGRRLDELKLRHKGINILAIERVRRFGVDMIRPRGQLVLQAGDVLLADMLAEDADAAAVFASQGLEVVPLGDGSRYFTSRTQQIGMVEVPVPAESPLVGQTILEARLRSEYGVTAIGLRRGRKPAGRNLLDQKLAVGDTLLLFGFWGDLQQLQREQADLVLLNLPAEFDDALPAPGRALEAVLCLALTVGLMISGVVPNVHAALIGCLMMGLLRCVDITSAYRAISWKTLVLIVGMLPFSIALQRTGGVDIAADALVAVAGQHSPRLVLALLFMTTALLGLFISNTATAVLMAPVAISTTIELGLSPYPFAMIVALAASAAFMTPVSSPTNTLVVAPGNYSFGDFLKVGVPFTLVVMVVSVAMVPWLLPLE